MIARVLAMAGALLALSISAFGQVSSPPLARVAPGAPGIGDAPEVVSSVVYRLTDAAAFEEGCFPPCLCPIFYNEDLGGTMRLSPMPTGTAGVHKWRVTDVNWFLTWGEIDSRRVTGTGVYTRTILPGAPPSHRLEMDLRVDEEAIEHYDSGIQALLNPTPTPVPVFDLKISRAGMVCYDRVFRVAAARPPAGSVTRYDASGTRYLEGCFPPCLCPIMYTVDVEGAFLLIALQRAQNMDHYALVNVRLGPSSLPPTLPLAVSGFGIYRMGSPGMLPVIQHHLVADLNVNGVVRRMQNELEPAPALLPTLDVDISENGFFCYDYALEILGEPSR